MNTPILSLQPHRTPDENKLIFFAPAETCIHCQRLTNVGILDEAMPQWFAPACPLHGLCSSYGKQPTAREQADQNYSIARFILWMYCDIGHVVQISPVEPDLVAGHKISTDPFTFEPIAWQCTYKTPSGDRHDVQVLWEIGESTFYLYRDGVLVSERHEEVAP